MCTLWSVSQKTHPDEAVFHFKREHAMRCWPHSTVNVAYVDMHNVEKGLRPGRVAERLDCNVYQIVATYSEKSHTSLQQKA